jgi:hypothetical protein
MSIERGTTALLTRRREKPVQGAEPIGWKIGFNVLEIQEKLGLDRPLAGYLSSDGLIEDGATWSLEDAAVVVESEVGVEIGDDGHSIAALMPALELADPIDFGLDVEQILAGNIFHRAVAFGPRVETSVPGPGRILVNGGAASPERGLYGPCARRHRAGRGRPAWLRLELEALGGVELRFS